MRKIIATTTINPPTKVLKAHAARSDWHVVVAGDEKTPHHLYDALDNVTYLHPEDQECLDTQLSDLIGWKCIQRRNMAILKAKQMGAEIIAIIDDDNVPLDHWGYTFVNTKCRAYNIKTNDIAFDPLYATNAGELMWHRGFPLSSVRKRNIQSITYEEVNVDAQADLWNGEPDIDAYQRAVLNYPNIRIKIERDDLQFPFTSNKFIPFNSQNIFVSADKIRDYFLCPHIGRMDDIWASYYFQAAGNNVVVGTPSVDSDRDIGTIGRYPIETDIERELIGVKHTSNLLKDLNDGKDKDEVFEKYLPETSFKALQRWREIV
tara:strand:+ start:720 stop:1676 length:957 start_codon:yes stop_codon:yes gene_type:complete